MGKHDRDLKPEDLINDPLYLLGRRVSGRTFRFEHDDIFLNARPDYVLWRLFFQTRPPLENAVDGCPAGPECAIQQLTKAAGLDPNVGINNAIKWACYGLAAQFLQFAFSSYPDDRATRRVRGIRPTDADRFTDDQIARLLTRFRYLHNKRIKEAKPWSDERPDTEKCWLLVLGVCALLHATIADAIDGEISDVGRLLAIVGSVEEQVSSLSRAGKTKTMGVLADIEEAVSKLFAGWRPGFSIPLRSFRQRIDGHAFYSALLPIHPDSYNHWAGEALGFLSKIALLQSTFYEAADRSRARRDRQLAFRLQMSAIQCQEHALRFYDNPSSEQASARMRQVSVIRERLIVLVDHARTLASYAGATYWEYGLAALHLRYCCSGGLQDPLDRIHRRSLKINKAIALAGGCQIPSEVESRDLDDQNDADLSGVLLPARAGLEPRTGFLKDQERRRAGIRPRTLYQLIQGKVAREVLSAHKTGALSDLSGKLGGPREFQSTPQMFRFLSGCSQAVRTRQGDYEALLDQSELAIRSFWDHNRVLDVAHTAKLLRETDRLAGSFLTTGAGLMLFAERLLELLEHPIGADVAARSFAQEQLVVCLALIDAEQERTLSYDDWLTLHTAAAHSGTVVTRALREELGDLVEASLFRDAAMGLESAAIVGRRARSALTESDTHTLLDEYNRRPPYRTALIHVTMVSPTRIKLLASGLRRDRILSWRQAEVRLPLGDKEDWEVVAEEAIDWPWFSNKDGVLFSGDDLPSANELGLLWASIDSLAQVVCGGDAKHVVLVPDAMLSSVPWQAIALRLGPRANVMVSLLPGVGWFSAHTGDQLFHERGLLLWVADAPTPTVECDIRPELAKRFLGREVTSFEYPQVAYLDNKSTEGGAVSLAVIVGHGQYDEADRLADATPVSSFEG